MVFFVDPFSVHLGRTQQCRSIMIHLEAFAELHAQSKVIAEILSGFNMTE